MLLAKRGEVVTKEELRRALWPDKRVVVFEASIAAVIRELRRILGDDPGTPRYIETIPKRGYRFVAPAAPMQPQVAQRTAVATDRHLTRGGLLRALAVLAVIFAVLLANNMQRYLPWPSAALDREPVTVAVMPFEHLSPPATDPAFPEAVAQHVIATLGKFLPGRLRVLDAGAGPEQGEQRPADYVLRCSVRDDRGAIVVSTRLLAGADGRFVWGRDYRRSSRDTSLAAREVAARIADSVISAALSPGHSRSAAAARNARAAAAFRRGTEALGASTREGTVEAVEAYQRATVLDPAFAAAHARLAEALISWTGPAVTAERVERARQAARRSIELDPALALGHRVLGKIAFYFDLDWQLARRYLERSMELGPADGAAHQGYAAWLSARGHHGEALREIDLARALDPASVAISMDVMLFYYYARDFDETIRAAKRLQKLWPGNEASYRYVILSRLQQDDFAGAAAEARARLATPALPDDGHATHARTDAEVLQAYWAATVDAVARYVRKTSGDPTALALLYVQVGRLDAALSELETAMSAPRYSYLLPYLGVSPAFDRMCGVPRFEQALRRLGQSALSGESDLARCEGIASAAGGSERAPRPRGT